MENKYFLAVNVHTGAWLGQYFSDKEEAEWNCAFFNVELSARAKRKQQFWTVMDSYDWAVFLDNAKKSLA